MRWLVAIAAACAPGCFYVDPINQRPSAEIVRDPGSPPVVRDPLAAPVEVSAKWSDPDNDPVTFSWAAMACTASGCDSQPFLTGTEDTFAFHAPEEASVTKIDVHLDVVDSHGAVARPGQDLLLDVVDRAPTVTLSVEGHPWRGFFPVTLPITVRASVTDPDDDLTTLTWQPPYALGTDMAKSAWSIPDPTDPTIRTFTPDVAGAWTIRVTADDGLGGVTTESPPTAVTSADDQPPCLGATDPALTTATIVLDQARRFSVFSVDDDLNVYPAPPPGGLLGAAGFRWSLATPASGGAFTALGTDENNVVIDPADYAPGDQLDVRVEVTDAVARTMPCDPSTAQCSMTADTTCLERQTWHLEVR